MSLARAFTKRTKERFGNIRSKASETVQTPRKISSPIALISSTNAQLFTAIDIADMQAASFSDASSAVSTRSSTDANEASGYSTPASSVESSPIHESPNPLSYYFPDSPNPSCEASPVVKADQLDAPVLPKRALSHSKREHVRLARQRSVRSSTQSISSNTSQSTIMDAPHPFSHELEQLSEMAEEFGLVAKEVMYDEDMKIMQSHGLMKFSVEEYAAEIEGLMAGVFEEGDFNGFF